MNDQDIDLSSVHWEQGMLLRPEHFLRQEKYFDSALLWTLRYAADGFGLVGGGGRVESVERGAAKHDPIVQVDDDGDTIRVSVGQCRGISPAGDIIEIDPSHAIDCETPRAAIEGHQEVGVYVVCEPHDKFVEEGVEDAANPQIKSTRRQRYRLQLSVTGAEAPHSLMVSRLRKAEGSLRYERVPGFIPVCTTLVGHSEMKRAWDRLRRQMDALNERYLELHKAIVSYIATMEGQVHTGADNEVLQFVGRMVMALESGMFDSLDPLQTPQRFLQRLNRLVRSALVYLELSPPTREYFRDLISMGITEFGALLEQDHRKLPVNAELTIHDNLSGDVQRIEQAFDKLQRLEEALEGKYLDFRICTVLEVLTFFYDRSSADPSFYESQARPARPQIYGDDLSFVFAPLRLDGRQSYRLVLIREEDARFDPNNSIPTIVQINQGAGQGHEPLYPKARCELPEQRNFAVDIKLPQEVHTVSDLRVTVNAASRIRGCMLYTKRLITPGSSRSPVPPPPQPPPLSGQRPQDSPRPAGGRIDPPQTDEPANEKPVRRRQRIEFTD